MDFLLSRFSASGCGRVRIIGLVKTTNIDAELGVLADYREVADRYALAQDRFGVYVVDHRPTPILYFSAKGSVTSSRYLTEW